MREKLRFWQLISPTEVQWHRKSMMQVSESEISLFRLTSIKFVKWLYLELHIVIWQNFFFLAFYGVTNISKSANGSAMTPEVNDAGQEFNFYFLFIPFFNAVQENWKYVATVWTIHCGFLVPVNAQKILWHQFWHKNDGENICNWNCFQIPRALSE